MRFLLFTEYVCARLLSARARGTHVKEREVADPLVAAEALGDESAEGGVALSHPPAPQGRYAHSSHSKPQTNSSVSWRKFRGGK